MNLTPLKGRILISEPFLQDPNFNRTVVLLTEHNDEGTVGYVLNHSTDVQVGMVLPELSSLDSVLYEGGPVEQDSFHFIHTYAEIPEASDLGNGIFWSGDFDHVQSGLLDGRYDPSQFKFFLGYSGWSKDQLNYEIHEEAWVVGEIDPTDVFTNALNDSELWRKAMKGLGGEFAILANSPINPHFN